VAAAVTVAAAMSAIRRGIPGADRAPTGLTGSFISHSSPWVDRRRELVTSMPIDRSTDGGEDMDPKLGLIDLE
jgi:hypothetical protein